MTAAAPAPRRPADQSPHVLAAERPAAALAPGARRGAGGGVPLPDRRRQRRPRPRRRGPALARRRARRAGRHHASCRGRRWRRRSRSRRRSAPPARRCRSSGAATSRRSTRTRRSTRPTSTTSCAARARRRCCELLAALPDAGPPAGRLASARDPSVPAAIAGLTWKDGAARSSTTPTGRSGRRTSCRRSPTSGRRRRPATCGRASWGRAPPSTRPPSAAATTATFCGVVSMWNGHTRLQAPERLGRRWRDAAGPLGRRRRAVLRPQLLRPRGDERARCWRCSAGSRMPWWCYARADTLAGFAPPPGS